jgi:hypothetical protein
VVGRARTWSTSTHAYILKSFILMGNIYVYVFPSMRRTFDLHPPNYVHNMHQFFLYELWASWQSAHSSSSLRPNLMLCMQPCCRYSWFQVHIRLGFVSSHYQLGATKIVNTSFIVKVEMQLDERKDRHYSSFWQSYLDIDCNNQLVQCYKSLHIMIANNLLRTHKLPCYIWWRSS